MKPTKFFRKYSRSLILVFMSLLLVVFLLGDVIGQRSGGGAVSIEVGRAFGRSISTNDIESAKNKAELVSMLGFGRLPVGEEDNVRRDVTVYLLIEEARQLGLVLSPEFAEMQIQRAGISSAAIDQLRERSGLSLTSLYRSISDVYAAFLLFGLQTDAAAMSLPRIETVYRDAMQNAKVKLSVIQASALTDQVAEPSEAELEAFFQAHKDQAPAASRDELSFGYRLPDRIKLEYLTVDPQELLGSVRIRERDVERFFDLNRGRYIRRVPKADTPAGQPQQFDTVPQTFEEVRDQVREDYRQQKAIDEAARVVNTMHEAARNPWDAAPVGDDGFRNAPPAADQVSFDALKQRFGREAPVTLYQSDLISAQEFFKVPLLGAAVLTSGRQQLQASQFAFRVKGLISVDPNDPLPVLNVDEPSPVVVYRRRIGNTRNVEPYQYFVFRVTEVEPSAPPASLDVVRSQVEQDYKLMKAYDLAREWAEKLAAKAREVGLEQAVADATELKQLIAPAATSQPSEPADPALAAFTPRTVDMTRRTRGLPVVGFLPQLHEEVFALLEGTASQSSAAHKVAVVGNPPRFSWVIAEPESEEPLYAGAFQQRLPMILQQASSNEAQQIAAMWFSTQNVWARTGFEPADALKPQPRPDEATESAE